MGFSRQGYWNELPFPPLGLLSVGPDKTQGQSSAGIRTDIVRGGGGQDNLGCLGDDSAVCTPHSTLRDATFYTCTHTHTQTHSNTHTHKLTHTHIHSHTHTHSQYTVHLPHPCWVFIVRAPLPREVNGEPLSQPDEGLLCSSVGAGRGAAGPVLWEMALIVLGPLFSRTCTAAHAV